MASFFCCVTGGLLGAVYGGTATPASASVMGGMAGAELPPPSREARKPPFLGASSARAGREPRAALVESSRVDSEPARRMVADSGCAAA